MPEFKSPYRCASENGLVFGLYLTALTFCMIFSGKAAIIGLVASALLLGTPFFLYRRLRTDFIGSKCTMTFGGVWLDGLLSFIFAALISSFFVFIYLRWLNPSFLQVQWDTAIDLWEASDDPQMLKFASDCRTAVANGFSITPILFTMSLLWFSSFAGSILSLILALVIRNVKVRRSPL